MSSFSVRPTLYCIRPLLSAIRRDQGDTVSFVSEEEPSFLSIPLHLQPEVIYKFLNIISVITYVFPLLMGIYVDFKF